ncbi:MAG: hypothetical protein RL329_3834 [Bacteroidota bacterium]|jgi:hypothetical protein
MKPRKFHKDMKKQTEENRLAAELFWKEEYPLLSLEARKQFWLRRFYQDRRHTEESTGHNGGDWFAPETIEALRQYDTEIDVIMTFVKQKMADIWFGDE